MLMLKLLMLMLMLMMMLLEKKDRDRMTESRDELARMLGEDELRDAVLLVLANKQDLPQALSPAEVTEKLGLPGLAGRKWYIQATCATTGEGLIEGLEWLSGQLKNAN